MDLRCNYFRVTAHNFDFFLILTNIFSVVVNALQYALKASEMSNTGINRFGILRVARIMRVFRVMRIGRLKQIYQVVKAHLMGKDLNPEVAERLQKVTILTNYVKAHVKSQQKATHIFGKNSLSDVVELAHSILESQICCYKAILLAVRVQSHLDESMLREVNEKKHRKKLAEELQGFVVDAHHVGVISAKEADNILHPLKDMIHVCDRKICESHFGFVSRDLSGETLADLERMNSSLRSEPVWESLGDPSEIPSGENQSTPVVPGPSSSLHDSPGLLQYHHDAPYRGTSLEDLMQREDAAYSRVEDDSGVQRVKSKERAKSKESGELESSRTSSDTFGSHARQQS